jgi:hypothetical protein
VVTSYVHPHIASIATGIVDDFHEAGRVLAELPGHDRPAGAVPDWLMPAVGEYRENVLPGDAPMLEALAALGIPRDPGYLPERQP